MNYLIENMDYLREECEQFMLESNKIEGENRVNPNDVEAVALVLKRINTVKDILLLHSTVGRYLRKDWVGKFRECDVMVGSYTPPHFTKVPDLMKQYIKDLPKLKSWEAHNELEKIHPFEDLNGRIGRLIWLSKAVKEGYNFNIPFLQAYYYQTLDNYEKNKI